MTEKLAQKLLGEAQDVEALLSKIDRTIFECKKSLKGHLKLRDAAYVDLREIINRDREPLLTDQDAMGKEEARNE